MGFFRGKIPKSVFFEVNLLLVFVVPDSPVTPFIFSLKMSDHAVPYDLVAIFRVHRNHAQSILAMCLPVTLWQLRTKTVYLHSLPAVMRCAIYPGALSWVMVVIVHLSNFNPALYRVMSEQTSHQVHSILFYVICSHF